MQKKFSKHVKRQKNSALNEKINQSVESNPELTTWLELADKTFTTIIYYMLKSQRHEKDLNQTFRDETCNVFDKKYTGWD